MSTVKMSEARLNDLVYLTLGKLFFEGMKMMPRECDIRVCMDMTCKERMTVASAILLPNEVAGKSHDIFYEVDVDACFDECVSYMEDHWMKQTVDDAFGEEGTRDKMKAWYKEYIVPSVLGLPEEQCGG